jgi:hypothetical protein
MMKNTTESVIPVSLEHNTNMIVNTTTESVIPVSLEHNTNMIVNTTTGSMIPFWESRQAHDQSTSMTPMSLGN